MKLVATIFLSFVLMLSLNNLQASNIVQMIDQKKWIHGSSDCDTNSDSAIDILKLDENSFILRQNKCLHYEAPFITILFGTRRVFVQDTGATSDSKTFPLFITINRLVEEYQKKYSIAELEWVVTHSHSHDDHYAGDSQFRGKPNVTLVEPTSNAVKKYFGFADWPNGKSVLDLGDRKLTIMPIPGHQEDALAVYDTVTQLIFSGDSFYPGRLYIRNWDEYKTSIQKLVDFTQNNPVKGLVGTHIEMSNSGKDYPVSTIYQPDETSLVLTIDDLVELNKQLTLLGEKPTRKTVNKVIIYPVD